MKNKTKLIKCFKLIKYFVITLLIIIPIIKLFLDLQFGITLRNDDKIIYTYLYIYSFLIIILLLLVRKTSFTIISILFLLIYWVILYIGNGLDDTLCSLKEYPSQNNQNVLLVDIQSSWYPNANVRFYKEVGPFFKKKIRTPVIDSFFNDHNNVSIDITWKDDNTVIISGDVLRGNITKLKKVKEKLPDKCDYEMIDGKLYLNLNN